MRKSPKENQTEKINKSVKLVSQIPWRRCAKCGDYIRFEMMYKETFANKYFNETVYGCTECFKSKEEFYNFNRPEVIDKTKPVPPALRIEKEKW